MRLQTLFTILLLQLDCIAPSLGAEPKVNKVRRKKIQSPAPSPPPVHSADSIKTPAPSSPDPIKKKPNILLIFADDVGTEDVPGYWDTNIVQMPNIKKLQSMGVTFIDAHSSPLCSPSRYSLLSGNYPHRGSTVQSTWNFWDGQNQFEPNQKSIAEVLKGANYRTWMAGKWHLGLETPSGNFHGTHILSKTGANWTNPVRDGPNDIGFDESFYTSGGIQEGPYAFFRNGVLVTQPSNVIFWPEGEYEMERGLSAIPSGGEGDKDWDSTAYNMIIVNETKAFLDNHNATGGDDPFFAYVALGAVHKPHSPPDHYMDGTPVAGEYSSPHFDLLLEMDKVVGTLVADIEDRGLLDDTIIIFASDNGGLNVLDVPRVLRGHKGNIYEGGHRIPMTFRYDGHYPKGEIRTSHFVGLNDMFATLAEIAEAPVPERSAQDSVSFAKYIESEENTGGLREYLGVWSYGKIEKKQQLKAESLRFKNLKLIQHYNPSRWTELYDLDNDLGETTSLSNNEEYQTILRVMRDKLNRLGPCPRDDPEPFYLSSGFHKGRRTMCNWFENDTSRCSDHFEGEIHCNSICGRFQTHCEHNPF